MKEKHNRLCRRLSYQFKDPSLLQAAMTHRSARGLNNERLEFLGDSILGLVIARALYEKFPKASEGQLSRMRASLVKGETLAQMATELELGECLFLGSGELKSGGFRRSSILEDAMEAVIGAVERDGGLQAAQDLVLHLYRQRLDEVDLDASTKDPKTRLQEYLQGLGKSLPAYEVIRISGDTHDQTFVVSCRIEDLAKPAQGKGGSRRKAEQAAAQKVLDTLDNQK
ncbi:MAG: ribonuclease III [Gammaproteobacteria bacterium]|nr:ribonuclease III [Gammaproteobacteria bacterium]